MASSRHLHAFLAAVQFLTRVPVPGGMNRPGADIGLLRAGVAYFPLVGAFVGLATGVVAWAAGHVWPPLVAVLIALAVESFLTGAFHEDAVADCCDAFGGGWDRDDIFRVLKDSRVGSFGVLGLGLAIALRAGCLAAIPPELLVPVAVASGAVSRWIILVMLAAVPPVPGRDGLSRDIAARVGWLSLLVGCVATVLGSAWYAAAEPLRFGVGLAAAVIVACVWALYVRRRLGGMTGDCLGAGCYLGQLAVLLAVAGWRP